MRGSTRAVLTAVATAALTLTGGSAIADADADNFAPGWTAPNGGVTVSEDGVVTLTDNETTGVSYENEDVDVLIEDGDTISFEYSGPCGGGAPRVFVQGGAYNTFDEDPNDDACGDATGDGDWWLVTTTIDGVTAGEAGHVGIVVDSLDGRTVMVRNLVIAGEEIQLVERGGGNGARAQNHGQCVSSADKGGEARSAEAKSDCGKPEQAQGKGKSDRS